MATTETAREKALVNYRKKLLEHRKLDARLKESKFIILSHVMFCLTRTELNSVLARQYTFVKILAKIYKLKA